MFVHEVGLRVFLLPELQAVWLLSGSTDLSWQQGILSVCSPHTGLTMISWLCPWLAHQRKPHIQ